MELEMRSRPGPFSASESVSAFSYQSPRQRGSIGCFRYYPSGSVSSRIATEMTDRRQGHPSYGYLRKGWFPGGNKGMCEWG
jgi:hypothetical protein